MNQPSTNQAINEVVQSQPKQASIDEPLRKIKRRRLWIVRFVLLLIILINVIFALTPMLLSSGPGTSMLVAWINGQVDGELQIDSLQLRWGAGQRIEGISYHDPAKGVDLKDGTLVAADLSLIALIQQNMNLGELSLVDATLVYTQNDRSQRGGDTSGSKQVKDASPFTLPAGLSGKLNVSNLKIDLQPREGSPVSFTVAAGSIDMPDLRDISIQLPVEVQQGLQQGNVSVVGNVLNLFDPDGVAQPMAASYQLDATAGLTTEVLDDIVRTLQPSTQQGLVTALLGQGDLSASAKATGTIQKLATEAHLRTKHARVDLFQIREGDALVASPDSTATFRLTPEAFKLLMKDSTLTLAQDAVFDLASFAFRLPVVDDEVDLDTATMRVQLASNDTLLFKDESDGTAEWLGVSALQVTGRSDAIAKRLAFEVSSVISTRDQAEQTTREPVQAELIVTNPLEAEREVVFFSEALPIKLADALAGQDGKLVMWLGERLALRVDLRGQVVADDEGDAKIIQQLTLLPEGRLTGEVVGAIQPGGVTLATNDKAPIQAVLVPEAFASLMEMLSGKPGEPLLTIDRPLPVLVTLRDAEKGEVAIVTQPIREAKDRLFIDPDRTYLGASIELPPARVYDPAMQTTYELRGGTIAVSAPDLRGKAELKADLNLWVRPDAGKAGVPALFTWQTTVADILDSDGAVPTDSVAFMQQVALQGGVGLQGVPSALFDSLLKREGDIASILGPIVQDLAAGFEYDDGRPTGASVKLNWDTNNNQPMSNAWASMTPAEFDIDSNQMLTIRGGNDIELDIKVTEAFGDRWMGQLHPILFDAKSGDRPIRVTIDGESFRFPLNDPTMKGARVDAVVDMGSIAFGDDALLGLLMEWTGRPGERAVFEPARVSLNDGRIQYDQLGMTVGNVQLRLDGEVDLASGTIVQMAVHVPGRSLTKIFHELEGIIAPDDFLSIPMTGSIRKPQFDRGLIVREVARLAAQGVVEQQKDKLFQDLFEDLGLPGRKAPPRQQRPQPAPAEEQGGDKPGQGDEADKPAEEPPAIEEQIRDELIDRGLELIFGGSRRDRNQENEE